MTKVYRHIISPPFPYQPLNYKALGNFITNTSIAGGNQAVPRASQESRSGTHAQGIRVWQDELFRWKSAPGSPMPRLHPSRRGRSPTASSARPKQRLRSRVSISCSNFVLEPTPYAVGPGSCWTQTVTCSWAGQREQMGRVQGTKQEKHTQKDRASFFVLLGL